MSNFEKASRVGLRFETTKGLLTVTDLWHLPLEDTRDGCDLDTLAQNLHATLKDRAEVSFVKKSTVSKTDESLELSFEIVKHIIKVRLEEADVKKQEIASKQHKAKIRNIIEKKKDEGLEAMSLEDLEKLIK